MKKLNWSGFGITFLLCMLAGFAREQEGETLLQSAIIGGVFGVIFGVMILIMGRKD